MGLWRELSECMKMGTHTTLVVVPPAFQAAEEAARKAKAEREEAEAKAAEEAAAAKAGAAVVQRRELRRMNRADQERCVISWLLASLRGSLFYSGIISYYYYSGSVCLSVGPFLAQLPSCRFMDALLTMMKNKDGKPGTNEYFRVAGE